MARINKFTDVFKHLDLNPIPPLTCWLWKGSTSDKGLPYLQVNGRKYVAYRVAYYCAHPDWDIANSSDFILHSCKDTDGNAVDNPLCCRPDHLRPGTHEENMMDMMLRGRAGLTQEIVYAIFEAADKFPDFTVAEVARYVSKISGRDVPQSTAQDILSGRRRRVMRELWRAKQRAIEESGSNE